MPLKNFELLNHPIRMRIFQSLYHVEMSVQQLTEYLKEVPQSSVYRHVRLLSEAGLLKITSTRQVNGIEERFYMSVKDFIDPREIEKPFGKQNFADFVSLYATIAAQDLGQYISSHEATDIKNIASRDHFFYATEEEFIAIREKIYQILREAEEKRSQPDGKLWRFFVIAHPVDSEASQSPPQGPEDHEGHSD